MRDEVPRNLVLLYFFADADSEGTRRDLAALASARDDLAVKRIHILGISPAKMPQLTAVQAELGLPFPLLRDDRDFAAAYGVESGEEASPALVLVGRDQSVLAKAHPAREVAARIIEMSQAIAGKSSPTANYPKSVINRLVDAWVN